ncbi:hypothetical protein DV735_g3825, partial [Chaetothyriales sp. CBS 134920]
MAVDWVHNASPEVNALSEWRLIVGVCISLTTLMVVTVGLRIYVRARMIRSVWIDDYIIIFSAVSSLRQATASELRATMLNMIRFAPLSTWTSILWCVFPPFALHLVVKKHFQLVVKKHFHLVVKKHFHLVINFAGRPFYMAGITGFKVALCFAYLRITNSSHNSRYRIFIWSIMAFATLSHVAGTLVLIFQCSPVQKSWRPRTEGKCLPNVATFYALASVTIVCDLVIFFAPIPLLARIRIGTRKKVGLIGIFTLGVFTTVCSVMRMVQIITISKNGNSTMLVLWGTIETNVGIFLTCLPCLTPLFTFLRDKTRAATSSYGMGSLGKKADTADSLHYLQRQSTNRSTARQNMSESHDMGSDSEEHILPIQGERQGQYITKTTVIEVKRYPGSPREGRAPRI